MKGCEWDTDGDGNCPRHPSGCPTVLWCGEFAQHGRHAWGEHECMGTDESGAHVESDD